MGSLMRLRLVALSFLLLNGCVAATALSAIPGVLANQAMDFFKGEETSLTLDMQASLASVQQGLEKMSLHVNVLEPVEDGYLVEFGNGELDGDIHLKRQTDQLTTMSISAHRGLAHQESVEEAMVRSVSDVSEQLAGDVRFNFDGYDRVYAKEDVNAGELGWFRKGEKLHVDIGREPGWLKLKLPSGKTGFIKGSFKDEEA